MKMEEIYRVNVFHDYFDDGYWDMRMEPTPETWVLLSRRNVLFKPAGTGRWRLLADSKNPFRQDDALFFSLKPQDPLYSYYTELTPENKIYPEGIPFRLFESEKEPEEGNGNEKNLFFYSKTLFWEYIICTGNRENDSSATLFLEEREHKIRFDRSGELSCQGKPCVRFVSHEKIKLKETYGYSLFLYEEKGYGRRILMKNLNPPVPGKFVCEREYCIRQFIYL